MWHRDFFGAMSRVTGPFIPLVSHPIVMTVVFYSWCSSRSSRRATVIDRMIAVLRAAFFLTATSSAAVQYWK